jgi:hypothetical protein
MNKMIAAIVLVGVGFLGFMAPRAKADDWDQKTVFTFSGPVEIPGQVLPAGTYVFKLANSTSNRNIVQVFSEDEKHLYGTFLAVADLQPRPAEKPTVTFEERPGDSAQAIKTWIYPGEEYGHEFVYSKSQETVAQANNTPAPEPEKPAPAAVEPAPAPTQDAAPMTEPQVQTEEPVQAQDEVAEVSGVETPAPTAEADLPDTLPKTASMLPLVGLLGLVSLGSVIGVRVAARG